MPLKVLTFSSTPTHLVSCHGLVWGLLVNHVKMHYILKLYYVNGIMGNKFFAFLINMPWRCDQRFKEFLGEKLLTT